MSGNNINLLDDFPITDYNTWLKVVEKSLKGKSFDDLRTLTYEGIIKKPIYIKSDIKNDIPSFPPFRRSFHTLSYILKPWKINIELFGKTLTEFNEKLKENLNKGVTSVRINLTPEYLNQRFTNFSNANDLKVAFGGANLDDIYLVFSFRNNFEKYCTLINEFVKSEGINQENVIIEYDPLDNFVLQGKKDSQVFNFYDFIIENKLNNYRFSISSNSFKEAGCSLSQELSFIFLKLVEILKYFDLKKYDYTHFLKNLVIQLKTGNDFFLELSKYRALRILWYNILNAYEIETDGIPLIYTKTLKANKSFLDYHSNILRNTIEGLSAVLGGIDILELSYFDDFYKEDILDFTQRITRNIQLLLQEEFNLVNIIDPAGGSYYIENITNELLTHSWNLFKALQNSGGFLQAISKNLIQNEIIKIRNKKVKNFNSRKEILIGVNKYPNLNDEVINLNIKNELNDFDFEPLTPVRFAEPFEKLRLKSLKYQNKFSKKPTVFVASYGKLAHLKARLDFINDFLNVGGIYTENSEISFDINTIYNQFNSYNYKIIIFCALDDHYQEFLTQIIPMINQNHQNIKKILAGYPKDQIETLKMLGIDEFIHLNSDIVEVLNKFYNWL